MSDKSFDCAIIGGGLAGLTLAIQLADSGRGVILFEKEEFPFNKVCGEYISMESHKFLQRIGLQLSAMDIPYITEVMVSAVNGNSLMRKLDLGGFGISRYTLDWQLAQLAIKKGVTLLQKTKVFTVSEKEGTFIIKAGDKSYGSKLVFGAYGKRSSLERNIEGAKSTGTRGERNYVAVKYHVKADLSANRIELHNFKGGYCGISKVDGDKYCLCYLIDSGNLTQSGNDIKTMEQNVVMQNPFLRKYFTESTFLYNEPLTISQITFKRKLPINGNVIMLGDAAGTIAPLCGNGMSMAMHASYIAALLSDDFFNGKINYEQLHSQYTERWNIQFARRIQIGEWIQGLFGKNYITNLSIGFLRAFPGVADKLISMTHGKTF